MLPSGRPSTTAAALLHLPTSGDADPSGGCLSGLGLREGRGRVLALLEDQPGHRQEHLVHVEGRLRRRLEELDAKLLGDLLGSRGETQHVKGK
jgi:hypothetical protein